ncbi:MAG: glycosyltransferase [Planctomycetes bacterium]|nr:glycosyltransferase [Planctomycetota bacterium]
MASATLITGPDCDTVREESPPAGERTATVVIATRNRCEDLLEAVSSALKQTAVTEVIVLDDCSDDGTSERIADCFPQVRLYRSQSPVGYIALRNLGNSLSRNEYVVSIDDDATFSTTTVIEEALQVFDHSAVGAAAIPFINVNRNPELLQHPPDQRSAYLTETFIGTAHVLRQDLFTELRGYREEFIHQGEETDYSLRLADRGYYVCLADSHPILHHESPKRSYARMDFYGRRNDCLIALWNVPLIFLPIHLPLTLIGGLWFGIRRGKPLSMLFGSLAGLWDGVTGLSNRRPVSARAYRFHKRSKRLRTY